MNTKSKVTVIPPVPREQVEQKPTVFDTMLARQDLDRRGLMEAGIEGDAAYRDTVSTSSGEAADFLRNPFFHVVEPGGAYDSGMVAHRGVLHEHEYVDRAELRRAVEAELGFSYEQIRSVYRQGPLTGPQRELRSRIDARMLALRRSGANMVELGRALGLPTRSDGHCRILDNAVARAQEAE